MFIAGVELANAFTELNDPVEQRARLEREQTERRRAGNPVYDIDERFLSALSAGMPPAGGIALGLDRLLMVKTGVTDIREVLAFDWSVS